uniref:Putative polyadenylation factor i complex subunit pfs2 n=1 Tax=Lutzomyia longipalpis TaxID=7200 RepID=A0A1B0EW55_LUTLO
MEFAVPPPPTGANFSIPPTGMPRSFQGGFQGGMMGGGAGRPGMPYFRSMSGFPRGPGGMPMSQDDFDGKRLRKSVMRKTVDYNASIIRSLENRIWQRDSRDRRALQPESIYTPELLPPPSYMDNPSNSVTTKFVKTATNKMKCPIFTLAWTPEGRRLVTGASSGEFTLWNGLTFNFETILQAHDAPVRTMVWSHNDNWMVTGDHGGYVKYWQSNMNNVKMYQAHKEPIRGISFSPSDNKFATCSDDGTLRVFDFYRCVEERVLRGHGADVKCVHWHPQKALIVSGSKDNQQPIKLWDPKSGQALATLHAHKSTVMDLKWNDNGNWLVTASRDHLLKLFDLRNLSEEVQIFRGHKKEASAVSWHPIHEGLFSSGGSDGSVLFWNVGTDKEVGAIDTAHDSIVWTLAWHPLGHILCSGSNDHTIKFWTRNRPGDQMHDHVVIPGMGLEDKSDFTESLTAERDYIPGLDIEPEHDRHRDKKPYNKPIPRKFQAQWNDSGKMEEETTSQEIKEVITQIVENAPATRGTPSAIVVQGKVIQVIAGSLLEAAIIEGPAALSQFISSGGIEELKDVLPEEKTEKTDEAEEEGDEPAPKRTLIDHNVQYIYDKPSGPSIPSLMDLKLDTVNKALIVSGSKDNQQPIKLWDPKSGQALATLHAHKSTVMDLKWNDNGNWLVTASRDHLLKLFDLRNLSEEVQIFRGHKKEASAVSWHPIHEGLFSSGGSDGSVLFWNVGTDKEVGAIDTAHDSIVWTLAWHPLGHILCSGSNDHTIKFWTRNRPDDHVVIPGMGLEDKSDFTESLTAERDYIPGLDIEPEHDRHRDKKPYNKPIPRKFQAQWNDSGKMEEETTSQEIKEVITQIVENAPATRGTPSAIVVQGKVIQVIAGSLLEAAIIEGPAALSQFISSGGIEELKDVLPEEKTEKTDEAEEEGDEPAPKRTLIDHNVQYIYDKPSGPSIPSLMDLKLDTVNVNLPPSTVPPKYDRDRLRNGTGEPVAALTSPWQSTTGQPAAVTPSPWAFGQAPQSLNEVTQNFRSNLNAVAFGPSVGSGTSSNGNGNAARKVEPFRDGRNRNVDGGTDRSRRAGSGERSRRSGNRWGRR